MAAIAMMATVLVAGVDAALSAGLLAIYARSFTKVRAPFTIGLIMFSLFFLAQNLLAVYAYFTMMEIFPSALAPYMLGIMAFEGLALGVMLFSSYK